MLTLIENLLDKATVAEFRRALDQAAWEDGKSTAGGQAAAAKNNQQLSDDTEVARSLGKRILQVIGSHPLFISAALPEKIFPPKFNRYSDGGHYGLHVDNAVMTSPGTGTMIRSDLSATLFLSEPESYDGGELVIETQYGAQSVKLQAGDLVLYPSSSLHQVMPVTRGARVASFFWIQSMIRDGYPRGLLFDLDQSIQSLTATNGQSDPDVARLTSVYHNLVRHWADV